MVFSHAKQPAFLRMRKETKVMDDVDLSSGQMAAYTSVPGTNGRYQSLFGVDDPQFGRRTRSSVAGGSNHRPSLQSFTRTRNKMIVGDERFLCPRCVMDAGHLSRR